MREPRLPRALRKAAPPTVAALLFLLAVFTLVAPEVWSSSPILRVGAAGVLLAGAGTVALAASKAEERARLTAPPPASSIPSRTTVSPGTGSAAGRAPHIMSQDLLKTAAEQKKTIEELRATVQVLEKQLAGMRLQAGLDAEGETVSLWSEEYFKRIMQSELWQSRRTQRPMSLLVIDFSDEGAARVRTSQTSATVDSSVWQYYAETVCRAVRGGDLVGLIPGGALCVLLTETTPDDAKVAQERVMKLVEKERQRRKSPSDNLLAINTAVVGFPRDGKDYDELILAGRKTILRAQRDSRGP